MTALALHPAARRRLAQKMPPPAPHEVVLAPLGGGDGRAIIVTSDSQDFVEAVFEDLKAPDWRERLEALRGRRRGGDGLLELGLPIHRRFQLALFEARCPTAGSPRVDPARISGQGMVLRRRGAHGWEGWVRGGKTVFGWQAVLRPDEDPDPVIGAAGHPANLKARALLTANGPVASGAETILPLYIAPPDVCAAVGRTVLFGVIPVVSAERSDLPPPPVNYASLPDADRTEMVRHLSEYLKARPPMAMPRAGEALDAGWNVLDTPTDAESGRLNAFGVFLQQLLIELDALGAGPAARTLMAALGDIHLPTRRDALGGTIESVDAASFVAAAAPILIGREPNSGGLAMPLEWPRVDDATGARLTAAALDCLTARHAAVVGAPAKFDEAGDRYAVRGFVRAKGHDGCPDRLVWSPASEDFRVLPWWDGDGPGATISLPELGKLKKVKPNVAFAMPPEIANLLKGDMKKLADGEGDTGGPAIAWLCSFSIPFITICAFIVLNIFLSLFDLIFRWMLFIKICIPIPKKA